jgi:hypothetical protein
MANDMTKLVRIKQLREQYDQITKKGDPKDEPQARNLLKDIQQLEREARRG